MPSIRLAPAPQGAGGRYLIICPSCSGQRYATASERTDIHTECTRCAAIPNNCAMCGNPARIGRPLVTMERLLIQDAYGSWQVHRRKICASCQGEMGYCAHNEARIANLYEIPDCCADGDEDEEEYDEDGNLVQRRRARRTNRIHQYSYKPSPIYHLGKQEKPEQRNKLHYGMELEVEVPPGVDFNVLLTQIEASWLYAKSDSSISNGFELVSHPFTFEWMRENRSEFEKRWKHLLAAGCRSHNTNTCGTHVHMSKDAFTSFHLYKFMNFIYSNPQFVKHISQRHGDGMEHYASLHREIPELMIRKARRKQGNMNEDQGRDSRRVAVNLENTHTVELRFFRGNLRPDRFFKNIEFCEALYQFSKQAALDELTAASFTAWTTRQRKTYPNLTKFLVDTSIVSSTEPELIPEEVK